MSLKYFWWYESDNNKHYIFYKSESYLTRFPYYFKSRRDAVKFLSLIDRTMDISDKTENRVFDKMRGFAVVNNIDLI